MARTRVVARVMSRGVLPREGGLKPPVTSGMPPGRGGYVGWRYALPYAMLL